MANQQHLFLGVTSTMANQRSIVSSNKMNEKKFLCCAVALVKLHLKKLIKSAKIFVRSFKRFGHCTSSVGLFFPPVARDMVMRIVQRKTFTTYHPSNYCFATDIYV